MLVVVGGVLLLGVVVGGLANSELFQGALDDVLARTNPWGLLLAISIISLATPATALRWRALMPSPANHSVGWLLLTGIQTVGLVFNYALPGPFGEVVAASMVQRRWSIPLSEALVASIVSRLVGLGTASLLAGVLYVGTDLPVPEQYDGLVGAAAGVLGVGGVGLVGAALVPHWLERVIGWVFTPLTRLPGVLGRGIAALQRFGEQVVQALAATTRRGPRPFLEATGWACFGHLSVSTGIAVAAWSLGLEPPWSGVVFTYTAATAGAVALFLFPGSHLGWDVMFGAIFAASTGVGVADAAALTVVVRVQQAVIVLVGVACVLLLAQDLLPSADEVEASSGG